jgi:hypothetical protein
MPGALAIVTASDSAYFSLLRGLLRSVRNTAPEDGVCLFVIDLGLSPEQRAWTDSYVDGVADGRWDLDFPDRSLAPRHLQAFTCRPFLPAYFPGHETYLWLDADAWVQDWRAVELFRRAAADGSIGVVAELDRAYSLHFDHGKARKWMHQRYRSAFGKDAADVLCRYPILNAGVFSMLGDSPGWDGWAGLLERGLRLTQDDVDQTALNLLVYAGDLTANFLPAEANWICHWAAPALDTATGRLVHPMLPHRDLGIVHLVGPRPKAGPMELETTDGREVSRWLTYGAEPR